MTDLAGLDELRAASVAAWPRHVTIDVEGAGHSGASLSNNLDSFRRYGLVPRVLAASATRDLSVTIFGRRLSLPVMLTPIGSQKRFHPDGEVAAMRAAHAAGTGMGLAASSSLALEDFAAAVPDGLRWLQLAPFRDRRILHDLARRGEDAGFGAIIMMVGTPIRVTHGWIPARVPADRGDWDWPNLQPYRDGLRPQGDDLADRLYGAARDPGYRWSDIEALCRATALPVVLKGVMFPQDARAAAEVGVAGITVSNTGGRQLDHAPGTLDALPAIVEAVGRRLAVFCDGGIRRGADVAKALALGAHTVFVGRPYLWGLGAAGEAGVRHVIETLRRELDEVMAMVGRDTIAALDRSILWRREQAPDADLRP